MIRYAAVAVLALTLAAPAAAAPAKAPKVSIASFTQLKTPLPYPYDEKADADAGAASAKVAAANARAKASGKLLLIDLGGNWCGDCRILAATMDLPEMKTFVDRHYETVEGGRRPHGQEPAGAGEIRHHRAAGRASPAC